MHKPDDWPGGQAKKVLEEFRAALEGGWPTKTYPRMTWAANHSHTCNLCDPEKNPDHGCNCGAELIDLIRSELMSDEHPISEWEVQFAEKIKALPMFKEPRP
ncbi:MAG: hypothetical protein KGL44_05450 [Sphingomonadales bacterium]|nr:hypothetical protein [Sphingomonadales bacterium]